MWLQNQLALKQSPQTTDALSAVRIHVTIPGHREICVPS